MAATQILTVTFLAVLVRSSLGESWTKDIKVKYFSTAILACNESRVHFPEHRIFWITPDAEVVTESTKNLPENVRLVNGTVISMLNISKVSDPQFGYYTCVMINAGDGAVSVTRWGLNVDGADFSELEDRYRDGAIVGAIAAAVLLVLFGGLCLVWHFRYGRRVGRNERLSSIEDDSKKCPVKYKNNGYDSDGDVEMEETSGVKVGEDGDPKMGGAQTFKM